MAEILPQRTPPGESELFESRASATNIESYIESVKPPWRGHHGQTVLVVNFLSEPFGSYTEVVAAFVRVGLEQLRLDIALAETRNDHDDQLTATALTGRVFEGRSHGSAR
jgi:hypothetical protein